MWTRRRFRWASSQRFEGRCGRPGSISRTARARIRTTTSWRWRSTRSTARPIAGACSRSTTTWTATPTPSPVPSPATTAITGSIRAGGACRPRPAGRRSPIRCGEGWARVTPFLHGWLAQRGAFADPSGHGDPNHPERTNFENWTELFDPNARGSYQDRFQHGYAGWPTFSAWGNAPLRVYAGEYASYWSYWNNRPESEAQDWGDAAMRSGADGYLDGGRVPVRPRLLR